MLRVYCVLAVSLAIWSTGFPAISAAVKVYAPLEMAAFRMVVGGALILLICVITGKRIIPDRRDVLPSALCGLIGLATYNILLGYGQQHITAAEASLLVALTPVFTVLASVAFLGERVGWKTTAGIAVSFSGVAVMALVVLLAAATQALLTILQKRMLTRYDPLEVTAFCIQFAMIAVLPLGWQAFPKAIANPFSEATLAMLYLAVFSLVLGYLGWAYVLQKLSASRTVSFLYVVPVGATIVGYFWLGEIPDRGAFIGGGIALIGVGIVNYRRLRKAKAVKTP